MFAGKKSAQIREILISESAWEEMTCLFAPSLGLLNRMAPQLSIFVIGFPLTLTVGISLMAALMPLIAPFCEHLFSEMFNLLADIISELPLI